MSHRYRSAMVDLEERLEARIAAEVRHAVLWERRRLAAILRRYFAGAANHDAALRTLVQAVEVEDE